MSNFLIDENPLVLLPTLAVKIGLNNAIVLQQIQFCISQKKSGEIIDGEKWIWNSAKEWQEDHFPFWSLSTINRAMAELKAMNLIVTCQPKAKNWDRTLYYRIDYEALKSQFCPPFSQVDKIGDVEPPTNELVNLTHSLSETSSETSTLTKRDDACEPIQDSAVKCASEGTNEGNMNTETGQSHDLFILDTETKTNRLINAAKGAENEKDLVKAYFRISNSTPTVKLINTCISAARESIERKVTEQDIEAAYAKSKEGKGFFVTNLWSLVGVADKIAQARRENETPPSNPDWEWRSLPNGERVLFDKVNGTVYKGDSATEMASKLAVQP